MPWPPRPARACGSPKQLQARTIQYWPQVATPWPHQQCLICQARQLHESGLPCSSASCRPSEQVWACATQHCQASCSSPVQMRACATQHRPPPATLSFSSLSMMAISCRAPPELTLDLAMLAWLACMIMRSSPLTASLQAHDGPSESIQLSHTAPLQASIGACRGCS